MLAGLAGGTTRESLVDRAAQAVSEQARLDFKRALCVAGARTIMQNVGVSRIDTGETLKKRMLQKAIGQKPNHAQTDPILIQGTEGSRFEGREFVLGERRVSYPDYRARKHTVGVVYVRELLGLDDERSLYLERDLAIADDPYRGRALVEI